MKPLEPERPHPLVRTRTAFEAALSRAPILSLQALVGLGPLIVIAPHPDDESLGCGGLIAAAVAAGIRVSVHILTDGRHSHPGSATWPPQRVAAQRKSEALRAANALRLRHAALRFERHVDGTLIHDWPRAQRIAARIGALARRFPSPVLVAPWRGDMHPDHMAASTIADLVEHACPRVRGLRYLVWAREQANHTPVRFDTAGLCRFPVHAWRARKRAAILAYRTQITRMITDVDPAHRAAPNLAPFLGFYEPYLASDA